jgi:hypothetical protein
MIYKKHEGGRFPGQNPPKKPLRPPPPPDNRTRQRVDGKKISRRRPDKSHDEGKGIRPALRPARGPSLPPKKRPVCFLAFMGKA